MELSLLQNCRCLFQNVSLVNESSANLLLSSASLSVEAHWTSFRVQLNMSRLLHAAATLQHKVTRRQMKEKESMVYPHINLVYFAYHS